jgi:hypothetical protein
VGAITAFVLADYREDSTLQYSELAQLVGPALSGLLPDPWIERMLVDRDTSQAGGRAIWNLPKELASFDWSGDPPRSVVVCDRDGEVVMSARWSQGRLSLPLPVLAPFLGTVDGDAVAPQGLTVPLPGCGVGGNSTSMKICGRCAAVQD